MQQQVVEELEKMEAIVGEPLCEVARAAIASMSLEEIRATRRWLGRAKVKLQEKEDSRW